MVHALLTEIRQRSKAPSVGTYLITLSVDSLRRTQLVLEEESQTLHPSNLKWILQTRLLLLKRCKDSRTDRLQTSLTLVWVKTSQSKKMHKRPPVTKIREFKWKSSTLLDPITQMIIRIMHIRSTIVLQNPTSEALLETPCNQVNENRTTNRICPSLSILSIIQTKEETLARCDRRWSVY